MIRTSHISTRVLLRALRTHNPNVPKSTDMAVKAILQKAQEDIKELTNMDVKVHLVIGSERVFHTKKGVIKVDISSVIMAACKAFDVDPKVLLKGTRKRYVADCRMAVSHLCRVRYNINSLQKIATFLALKNHTTIIHHVNTVNDLLVTNPEFEGNYYRAVDILEGNI